jgi:succinylglutamate desuccinylase
MDGYRDGFTECDDDKYSGNKPSEPTESEDSQSFEETQPSQSIHSGGMAWIKTCNDLEAALKAKRSPSFEREYNLKYLGRVGNVFHTLDIEAAICTQEEGQEMMQWSTSEMIGRSMGIDVAWGDQLSEETQRNATVDIYVTVKKIHQDPSITSAIDSITQNSNSVG